LQEDTEMTASNEDVAVSRRAAVAGGEAAARAVAARVTETLKASGYAALQSVAAEHHEGVLHLRGRVPSFYMKQIAQTVASKVHGVGVVDNRLSVDSAAGEP
jgi:osmotically-inducible protein OsmY